MPKKLYSTKRSAEIAAYKQGGRNHVYPVKGGYHVTRVHRKKK